MSAFLLVLLVVVLLAFGFTVAVGANLVRNAIRLFRSGKDFLGEVSPVVDELAAAGDKAAQHAAKLAERLAEPPFSGRR